MAIKQIKDFTLTKTDAPNGSYFGFDWWNGTSWETVKILAEDLASALATDNFANANLTATGNRLHDFNNFKLEIKKCSQIKFEVSSAPPTSESAVKITGYGASNSDLSFQLLTNVGTAISVFGDKHAVFSGQVSIGTPFSTTFAQELNGNSGNALYVGNSAVGVYVPSAGNVAGYFEGTNFGVDCYSSGTGKALRASANGTSIHSNGTAHIETYSFAGTKDPSTVLQLDSNTQGFVVPRMTTTQRDAISTPLTGLEVFDTTRGCKVVYNGSYWAAAPQTISFTSGSANLTAGSNYFFGNMAIFPTTTAANRQFLSPVSGVIRKAFIKSFASTIAGDRSINVYVRVNATDYLIATVNTAVANREFISTSLNIPIVANTDTVVCYAVASGGTTDSTGVFFAGQLIVE